MNFRIHRHTLASLGGAVVAAARQWAIDWMAGGRAGYGPATASGVYYGLLVNDGSFDTGR